MVAPNRQRSSYRPSYQTSHHYPYVHRVTVRAGLPVVVHVAYAVGGLLTCGAAWVAWAIHYALVRGTRLRVEPR